jgi:hypothetical protein
MRSRRRRSRFSPAARRVGLAVLAFAIAAASLTGVAHLPLRRGEWGTLIVDIDRDAVRSMLGMDSLVVASATISIPGVSEAAPARVYIDQQSVRVEFHVPRAALNESLAGSPGIYPTVTIILTSYAANRSASIVIPSSLAAREWLRERGVSKPSPDQVAEALAGNPLLLLSMHYIHVTGDTLRSLEKAGLVEVAGHAVGAGLLPSPSPPEGGAARCSEIHPGIAYCPNTTSPMAGEGLPGWWASRAADPGLARGGWSLLRSRLGAAYYLVSKSVNLDDAVNIIARYAYSPSQGSAGWYKAYNVTTVAYPLDSLPGGWRDTRYLYTGLLSILGLRMDSSDVEGGNLAHSLEAILTIALGALGPFVAGSTLDGLYAAAFESTMAGFGSKDYFTGLGEGRVEEHACVWGMVSSVGDYIITAWLVGEYNSTHWIIAPRVGAATLYALAIDPSTLRLCREPPRGAPGWASEPGRSTLFQAVYDNTTYRGMDRWLYALGTQQGAGIQGVPIIIGGPALAPALEVIGGSRGPFEDSSRLLVGLLLGTRYAGGRSGAGVAVTLGLVEVERPRVGYLVRVVNLVPPRYDGVGGVGNVTWGGFEVSVAPRPGGG